MIIVSEGGVGRLEDDSCDELESISSAEDDEDVDYGSLVLSRGGSVDEIWAQ